mgnify:CR=1 FL=1
MRIDSWLLALEFELLVDVALERAFHYVPGKPSEQIALPDDLAERSWTLGHRVVESPGDLALASFSIERDRQALDRPSRRLLERFL